MTFLNYKNITERSYANEVISIEKLNILYIERFHFHIIELDKYHFAMQNTLCYSRKKRNQQFWNVINK